MRFFCPVNLFVPLNANEKMKKPVFLTVLALIALVGVLAGIKFLQFRRMIDAGAQFVPPAETVTTAEVRAESWDSLVTAVGTLTAVQGVTVAAEMPGKVVHIAFVPGARVLPRWLGRSSPNCPPSSPLSDCS